MFGKKSLPFQLIQILESGSLLGCIEQSPGPSTEACAVNVKHPLAPEAKDLEVIGYTSISKPVLTNTETGTRRDILL